MPSEALHPHVQSPYDLSVEAKLDLTSEHDRSLLHLLHQAQFVAACDPMWVPPAAMQAHLSHLRAATEAYLQARSERSVA